MGLCLHMTSIKIRGNKAEFAIGNNLYIFRLIKNALFSPQVFCSVADQVMLLFYTSADVNSL